MDRTELLAEIRTYAGKNYNKGGWDVLVECWSDAEILEEIGKANTLRGAIWKLNKTLNFIADYRAEMMATAF